jgi:hypothetical protein
MNVYKNIQGICVLFIFIFEINLYLYGMDWVSRYETGIYKIALVENKC